MTEEHKLLNALCRESFSAFAARAFREVNPGIKLEWSWHIDLLCEHLQALYDGTLGKQRLCINVPPRTLKSFLASVAFPAWVLGKQSNDKFICTSFNATLAKEMSQKSRIIFESEWYKKVFPNTVIDDRQNEKHNFWTTSRGMYYSSAIQSVTGRGTSYVVIDDALNPKEASSPTIREDTNETIRSTLPSRFNDPRTAKWLLIMQRLHENDPTGNMVLNDERWYHVKLPAENLTGKDIIYRLNGKEWIFKAGDLLFPDRLSRQVLDELRQDMSEYHYVGQYLQEPAPIGGGEFRHEWIQYYQQGGIRPKEMNVAILCDPAGGDEMNKRKKKMSDWTYFSVIGLAPDNNYYLLDAVRDRLNPTERVDTLFMLHRKWNDLCGKSPKVGYEKYGMMSDTHYIREKQKNEGYNFPLIELGGGTMKEERIRRLIPDMQQGRWYLPSTLLYIDIEGRQYDLIRELIEGEMKSFPRSRYDDGLDCVSRIYEPDLFLTFPKPKIGMVKRAVMGYHGGGEPQSWEDF
jgi:predicted phage terminase large subunit-like protein